MKFLPNPSKLQIHQWLVMGASALLVAFAAGCASPGPPRAPSLNLPEVVKDLAADRVGDEVRLHWDTSAKTTDRIDIKGPVTAEICRVAVSPPASPPATTPTCTVVKRLSVQSGPTQTSDVLPQTLTADPAVLLAYRVQLVNANG